MRCSNFQYMSLRCFYVIVSCIFSACHLILIKVSSQKHINLDLLSQHALTQHFLRVVLGWSTCLINFLFHISLSWHCRISSISDDLKSPLIRKTTKIMEYRPMVVWCLPLANLHHLRLTKQFPKTPSTI